MERGTVLLRRGRRDVVTTALLANLLGAAVLFVFLQWLTAGTRGSSDNQILGLVFVSAYGLFAAAVMYIGAARAFTADLGWLQEGRAPTAEEQAAALAQPARLAAYCFRYWAGAAVLFGVLNATVFDSPLARTAQVTVTTLLGGLTACLAFFLAIERRLRPIFALALSGSLPARPATIGVRPRLILSWALGSGVALASLILLPLTLPQTRGHLVAASVFLASVGLVAGLILTVMAARSVADPIEGVRAGLRKVQAGDLDASLDVDDGGEIGLLQAGFNGMVAGLRERMLFRALLDRHIGDEVACYAVEHGVGLGGEVREVSALFVDVIGSTAIAQTRPATEVVGLLNELFRLVVGAVGAEGGWVNKFEGDAALCVFGAPSEQPDHPARALRAARKLTNSLSQWRTSGGLDAAVGVSSGEAVAGNVGSEERYEYTVIGDPVNEAARLCELAKFRPERVVASSVTVEAASGEADNWAACGEQTLRGRLTPTALYAPCNADIPHAGVESAVTDP